MWALVLGRGGFEPPKALGQLIYSQSRLTASVSARPADFTDNRRMSKRGWILWQGLIKPSMELFKTAASDQGIELQGLILQAHEDRPYAASYTIRVDQSWRTRDVAIEIELEDGGQRSLALSADAAGNWMRDGQRLSELDDCVDADLEWSPSTNTLPIRRLALARGETRAVAAAWIRFPSLEVQRLDQSYERLAERRYRYRSGLFTADLLVDDDGMVLQYGVNWTAVTTGG
jgi:uncharacterized protein